MYFWFAIRANTRIADSLGSAGKSNMSCNSRYCYFGEERMLLSHEMKAIKDIPYKFIVWSDPATIKRWRSSINQDSSDLLLTAMNTAWMWLSLLLRLAKFNITHLNILFIGWTAHFNKILQITMRSNQSSRKLWRNTRIHFKIIVFNRNSALTIFCWHHTPYIAIKEGVYGKPYHTLGTETSNGY